MEIVFDTDGDGCPDPDNDSDGISDKDDECPDKGEAILAVSKDQILLLQKILFATDSDVIVGKKSFQTLDTLIKILETNPDMEIRIEGHTDDKGAMEHNMDLSKRRAESVKKHLVDHGIDEGRLETEGFGPTKPIADNKTKEGRSENRRVEFHILK